MQFKAAYATHPLLLLLCAAAGTLLGLGPAAWSQPAWLVISVSNALLNLVCLPLLMVATLSGLRHLLGLPHPARRLLMIALASAALMLVCAQAGVLLAQWAQIGWQLDNSSQLELGRLVMGQGASGDVLRLGPEQAAGAVGADAARWALPDNVFFALSSGNLAAVMFCTLFFGLAFTAQRGPLSDSSVAMLEAVSRTLEKLIGMVNLAVPLLVLAYAAQLASQWNVALLRAMGGFLTSFWALSGLLCALMVLALVRLGSATLGQVLQALKVPALLSLVSGSPLAFVPAAIEGLSNRLGFSRGIVEMLMPSSAVFLRTGAALQYAMLAVFVAHLYGHALSPLEMLTLAPVAVAAALASAGSSGLASLGFAGTVVAYLKLPYEAALPLFAAIQLFSEGPARLLSLLCSCVLTAFVCGGLPMEKQSVPAQSAAPLGPVHFSLSRQSAAVVASCVTLTGVLSLVLGLALGLRQAGPLTAAQPSPPSLLPGSAPGLTP